MPSILKEQRQIVLNLYDSGIEPEVIAYQLDIGQEEVNTVRNVFLYNVKLDIHRKVVEGLKNVRGYEGLMLKVLEYPNIQIILECNCIHCRSYILRTLDVPVYKKRMILANIDSSKLSGVSLQIYKMEMDTLCSDIDPSILPEKCPACNTNNSLRIPFFNN